MQEQVNEKISLLIDDELQSNKALLLLETLRKDEELKQRLQRYQLISQVLKNDTCYMLDKKFAEKIHEKINQEPYLLRPHKKAGINWQKSKFALAASIVLAMVWVAQKNDKPLDYYPIPQSGIASNLSGRSFESQSSAEINPRINDYLQAHENGVYNNNLSPTYRGTLVGYQK